MNQPMLKYMSVGLVSFMAFPEMLADDMVALEKIRRIAQDDFFDAIEIARITDSSIREQAAAVLAQSHMRVCYVGSPVLMESGLNLNDLDAERREQAVAAMKANIDNAYQFGAEGFGFLSGRYQELQVEQAFSALVDSVHQLCTYAQALGNMKILLEVFDYDVDKCALIGPTLRAKSFAEAMQDCQNFGLMVDLSHIPLLHESINESVQPLSRFIQHAHMGNAVVIPGLDAYGDRHPRFGFPGGANDVEQLTAFLRALLDIGYLNEQNPGIVSFEVKPFGNEDSEMILASAKRTLKMAWARI
jgi:sugar phosphate isomerase/epimerase